jgi:hypothetical protein
MEKSLKYCWGMIHEYQQEHPDDVGRILQMKGGCARRRGLTLLGPNDKDQRELLLAFLALEPANLF